MNKHVKIAYYRQQDWNRLLAIISDREDMYDTWQEWYESFKRTKKQLSKNGLIVQEFEVDLDELIKFCFQNGMLIDGKARSQFVANR